MPFPAKNRNVARRFRQRVLAPVLGVFGAVAILCLVAVQFAASRSDRISTARQTREVQHALSDGLDELARTQEVAAVWDFLVQELRKPQPNWQWMDENVGLWLHRLFQHDQVFILNAGNEPIYATSGGQRVPPSMYAAANPALRALVDRTRGDTSAKNNPHERLPGQPLNARNTVRTGPHAVHSTDLITLGGKPAAVSVMRIVPLTKAVRPDAPGQEPLLVSVRFLDGSFLKDLEENNLIKAARFALTSAVSETERALPVTSSAGAHLGFFIWQPELPGSVMLKSLLPLVIASLALLGIAMALLSYRIFLLMRRDDLNLHNLESAHLELQASEGQAHHIAFHDVLTGLPNRALFVDCADQAMVRARNGDAATIMLLDLDRFKHVNDTWGHQAGDALIQEFGTRLARIAGPRDTVARLGGDEFAILTNDATRPEQIEALATRILAAVREPFEVIGNQAYVGVSIGAATAPAAGTDRTELMRKADIALYRAKQEGRDCYRAFDPSMDETVRMRATLEEDLRLALKTGQGLEVHYQPQLGSTGQRITGLEALARWRHPTQGFISPQMFVPIAEETGLIVQLTEWVLRDACKIALEWPHLSIAVNLSPVQFRTGGFAHAIASLVRSTGASPHQIELEVTEGVLVEDNEVVKTSLRELRKAGFRIALDDFGTGYSSLSYLRRFEVDKIKIDRSFVQPLGQAADSTAIVTAVVTLGHAMGLTVTAEGVETPEQLAILNAVGCNELQGFLFSRAVPREQLAELLSPPEDRAVA
jgi:diguanylate cyclase (GGDEF)-like protein